MKAVALVLLVVCVIGTHGYGESDAQGRPVWQERANHVFLNAARVSPSGYKSVYMAGFTPSPSNILVSYPAVPPVYLINQLYASAYQHSNEMAVKNYFSHNSFDGTAPFTRVKQYYTCSGTLAENIAAGYADPLATSNQWICDSTGSACAGDKSGSDGHRSNIMGSGYKAVGVGFAFGSSAQYKNYWTQDFGGSPCSPASTSPIYGASHRVASGSNKFIAVYYSTAGAPKSASVVIGGVSSPLSFEIGTTSMGTYVFSQTAATACRSYYFVFVDASGTTWRYPETGCLVTYGEGSCTNSFDSSCSGSATTTVAPTTTMAPTTTVTPTTTTTTMSSTSTAAPTTTTTTTTTRAPFTTTTRAPFTTTTVAPTTTTVAPTTTTVAPTTTTLAPTTTTLAPTTTTLAPATTTTSGLAQWQQNILNAHNTARASVGLKPLTWNTDAETVAKNYAGQCTFAHNGNRGNYGENIFANAPGSSQPSPDTATAGVNSWVGERSDFNCGSNTCNSGKVCGHWTQVAWSTTTSVGCGLVQCTKNSPFGSGFPTWNFMVCDYAPPGNWQGQAPYKC